MASVLIISGDSDFSSVIADLARRELAVECVVGDAENHADALVAVSDRPQDISLPLLVARPPIKCSELLSQIRALLSKAESDWTSHGKWSFSLRLKQISYGGKTAGLTDKELQLLEYLYNARGSVAKEKLLKEVWGFETEIDTHTLETHIYRLRAKCRELSEEQLIIATENGYKLA